MAIVDGSLQLGYKNTAWFTANASLVLLVGQIVYLEQTGTYKIGDGTTQLSALSFLGGSQGVQSVTGTNVDNTDPANPVVIPQTILSSPDGLSGIESADSIAALLASDGTNFSRIDVYPTEIQITESSISTNTPLMVNSSKSIKSLTAAVWGAFINSLNIKATPVNADSIHIIDSAASNTAKKLTLTNFKAFLKTYFDTIYTTASAVASQITTALSGYELLSNKQTDLTASATKYPTVDAVNTGLDLKQNKPIIVSASQTAKLDERYVVNATSTFTDPAPVEGKGFYVTVINGTATVGGTAYSTLGTTIFRVYHSGAWTNYVNLEGDIISFIFDGNAISPADSTTYFLNRALQPNTTASNHSANFGYNYTIIAAQVITITTTTAGSSENNEMYLRNITDSSSQLISNSIKTNATSTSIITNMITGLNLSFLAANNYCIEWRTPAYSTNPVGVTFRVTLFAKKIS